MRTIHWAVGVVCVVIGVTRAGAASNPLGSYDFYPTAAQGSARYVALGGATMADPNDYSAVFMNPAGLGGLAGDGIDIGADSNSIENFLVDPSQPSAKALNDPLKFSFFGFRYVTDQGWGFGFASQTPYKIDDLFSGTTKIRKSGGGGVATGQDITEIRAQSNIYTLAAARSFLDRKLTVGLAVNYIQVTEQYDFNPVFTTTAPVHQQATEDAASADIGVLAKPWPSLRIGGVYKMNYKAAFDPTRNNSTFGTFGKVAAFRDGKSPDRVALGLCWSPNRYWNLFAQGNVVFPIEDALVIGSNLFPNTKNTLRVQRSKTITGDWGVEFIPIDEPDFNFKMWAGGYLEDTGIEGGFTRYHRTAGFGLSPWFLSLNMAIDNTNLYNNYTVGLGVDLLQTASRVAKSLGYKLSV